MFAAGLLGTEDDLVNGSIAKVIWGISSYMTLS